MYIFVFVNPSYHTIYTTQAERFVYMHTVSMYTCLSQPSLRRWPQLGRIWRAKAQRTLYIYVCIRLYIYCFISLISYNTPQELSAEPTIFIYMHIDVYMLITTIASALAAAREDLAGESARYYYIYVFVYICSYEFMCSYVYTDRDIHTYICVKMERWSERGACSRVNPYSEHLVLRNNPPPI